MENFQTKKNKMFNLFRELFPLHSIGNELNYSFNDDRFIIDYKSKGKVILHLAIVKRGYKKGDFGVYSTFLIKDGEIYNIMNDLNLNNDESMPSNILLSGSYLNFIYRYPELEFSEFEHYPFTEEFDPEIIVKKIWVDIQKYYFPIVNAILFNSDKAISLILDDNLTSLVELRNPFTLCLILMGQSKDISRLNELINKAKEEENGYFDYINSKKTKVDIVRVVLNYFNIKSA